LPLKKNTRYSFEISVDAHVATTLDVELQCSSKIYNYTPDVLIEKQSIQLSKGVQKVTVSFKNTLANDQYAFLIFRTNQDVKIRCSEKRITGIVSVFNKTNPAVNNFGKQMPPEKSGFDAFEFWCPDRRPKGQNIAMTISPALNCYSKQNIINGYTRPYLHPNAWLADFNDKNPTIYLLWDKPKIINLVSLYFDTDFDHPMESSQMGHAEDIMPFCVQNYRIFINEKLIFTKHVNHQTINHIKFPNPVEASAMRIEMEHPSESVPSALFEIFIS